MIRPRRALRSARRARDPPCGFGGPRRRSSRCSTCFAIRRPWSTTSRRRRRRGRRRSAELAQAEQRAHRGPRARRMARQRPRGQATCPSTADRASASAPSHPARPGRASPGSGRAKARLGRRPVRAVDRGLRHDGRIPSRARSLARLAQVDVQPLISIVFPVYNPPEDFLRQAIDSVRAQLYTNWELCIADDCSTLPHVAKVLDGVRRAR